jgi:hypothetical protein
MTDRIEFDQSGVPHEFVVGGAHLVRINHGHWFLSMGRADGTSVAVWLQSDTPITVAYETRDAGRFMTPTHWEILAELDEGKLKWGAAVGACWKALVANGFAEPSFGGITQKGKKALKFWRDHAEGQKGPERSESPHD